MKRLIIFIICLAIMSCVTAPCAHAAANTHYTPPDYIVTIPESVTLDEDGYAKATIELTVSSMPTYMNSISVFLNADDFTLTAENTEGLSYSVLWNNTAIAANAGNTNLITLSAAGTEAGLLEIQCNATPVVGVTYTDSMTFGVDCDVTMQEYTFQASVKEYTFTAPAGMTWSEYLYSPYNTAFVTFPNPTLTQEYYQVWYRAPNEMWFRVAMSDVKTQVAKAVAAGSQQYFSDLTFQDTEITIIAPKYYNGSSYNYITWQMYVNSNIADENIWIDTNGYVRYSEQYIAMVLTLGDTTKYEHAKQGTYMSNSRLQSFAIIDELPS